MNDDQCMIERENGGRDMEQSDSQQDHPSGIPMPSPQEISILVLQLRLASLDARLRAIEDLLRPRCRFVLRALKMDLSLCSEACHSVPWRSTVTLSRERIWK